MKTIYLCSLFIITVFFLLSCEKGRKEVEIVPDLESIYINQNDVDVPAKEKEGFNAKAKEDLIDAVKTLDSDVPINFEINIRVFINENGSIDKIRDISNDNRLNEYSDTIKNYRQKDKLIEAVASKITDWQFEAAKYKGKNVKCWCDFKANIFKKQDGSYNLEMSEFLKSTPGMYDFIAADKMPQIKKIFPPKYPEQAKHSGIEGVVYVKILVNEDGKPTKSVVIRSDSEIFNQPALDAAMKFEFTPAVKDNRDISIWVVVPFKFKLDK
jgi:TonB family protein